MHAICIPGIRVTRKTIRERKKFLQQKIHSSRNANRVKECHWNDRDYIQARVPPSMACNQSLYQALFNATSTWNSNSLNENLCICIRLIDNISPLSITFSKNSRSMGRQLSPIRRSSVFTFHTFRHLKGTWEYHKTKDILHVTQILGHKNIKNTLIYVQLAEDLFKDQQEYVSKSSQDRGGCLRTRGCRFWIRLWLQRRQDL